MFAKLDQVERPFCIWAARLHQRRFWGPWFQFFSWVGNGPAWGILLSWCAWYSWDEIGQDLLVITAINLLLYRILKGKTVRRRPFVSIAQVSNGARALDEFSFPSGHTLHAVAITSALLLSMPGLAVCLMPVTAMIMLSRVVLGLHYPSDVMAGAALGLLVSGWVLGF